MAIPVSVRIYDVTLPDEVHMQSSFQIWWDHLQYMEGYYPVTETNFNDFKALSDEYFDYLVSKRVMPYDNWSKTRFDSSFADYAANYLAVAPEIASYGLYNSYLDFNGIRNTLTVLIEKNIELAQSGSDVDLFKKAYFLLYDEPETNAEYKEVNNLTAQLDAIKNELAPMLAEYPALQESFMNLKHIVTAQHPDDATYDKMWQDVGSTELTGSIIYCPQYQYLNTESQRAYYAGEEELWWYGCCFPTEPFATYHINSPLIAARAVSWMMYDYDIDGLLYASVNNWGTYNNDGSVNFYDIWNGYQSGTPGDSILVYPGSEYGVYGPIGTVRLENIRESNEDYEYLWLLENEFGADISAYTKGLYDGVIVTGVYDGQTVDPDGDGNTDALTIYHTNRFALLEKLEQLSIAENGETVIIRQESIDEDWINMSVDAGMSNAGFSFAHDLVKAEKSSTSLRLDTANAKINYTISPQWDLAEKKIDMTSGILSGYFHFGGGTAYAAAELVSSNWKYTGRMEFELEDLGDGWYYGTLDTSKYDFSATDLAAGASKENTIRIRFYFRQNLIVHMDGLKYEEAVVKTDQNDMFTGGVWISGSQWTSGTNMTYDSNCTEVYGEDSVSSWKFNATAANNNQWAQFMMGMTQSYDLRDYYFVFDAKVDGVASQQLSIRPRTGTDGSKDPCNNTVVTLAGGWNTYTVDFAAALKAASSMEDLAVVQRIFLVFNFAASTGSDRSVVIDNVRLIQKSCQHTSTTTTTVDATCASAGSVTVTCNTCGETISTEVIPALPHNDEAVVTAPSFSAGGYTTYTCSVCGNSYVTDQVPAYTAKVTEWNIALADDVRANFHLDIDSRLENAFVTVLVEGYGYKYALSELATTEEGYYIVSANAAAAQMTEDISIVVSSGDLESEAMTYTIRQYAEYILTGNYDDNTKLLVQRMLNYGAAAQTYFTYNTDHMANSGYEMTDVPVIPEAEDGSVASGDVVGIDYYGASLLYETKVGVRFYYTVTGRIEDYTFTDTLGNTYEPVAKGGRYYIEVMNINPNQYDDVIEMLVTDGTNTQSVSYSPMRYISRKYYGSNNSDLVNLVAKMYQYHKAAKTYLGEDKETVDSDWINMILDEGMTNAGYSFSNDMVKAEGSTTSLRLDTANAKINYTFSPQWHFAEKKVDMTNGILSGYFHFGGGTVYAAAELISDNWKQTGRMEFQLEDLGDGWYYGTLDTSKYNFSETDLAAGADKANTIRLRLYFRQNLIIHVDGLQYQDRTDRNDMFTGGAWISGSQWTTGNKMTYDSSCTETYGEGSFSSWKFSADAANTNQWAQFLMGMTQSYNMDGYYLVFDAKVEGVSSQKLSIRPRSGADGAKDPCNNTVLELTSGWNTYTVDFGAALKSSSSAEDLSAVQRLFLVFDFAASTGADRSVIIDNVRLVKK